MVTAFNKVLGLPALSPIDDRVNSLAGVFPAEGLRIRHRSKCDQLGLAPHVLRIPRAPSVATGFALTVISAVTLLPLDRKW